MLKGSKYLKSLYDSTFIIFFHHSGKNWVAKCLSLWYVSLGLFVNTLTANDKYSLRDSQNLPQLIQMHLSNKKVFRNFLLHFWNLNQILNIFN